MVVLVLVVAAVAVTTNVVASKEATAVVDAVSRCVSGSCGKL